MKRFQDLLLNFSGRIGRGRFWLGALCLIVASFVLSGLAILLGFGETTVREGYQVVNGERTEISGFHATTSPAATLVISILLLTPWLAVAMKRRHDRGSHGYDVLGFSGLTLLTQALVTFGVSGDFLFVLHVVGLVWGVILLILLGFLKGDSDSNAYGPNPLVQVSA